MTSNLHRDEALSDSDRHWKNELSLETQRGDNGGVLAGVGRAVLTARDLSRVRRDGEKLLATAGDVARRRPFQMVAAAFAAGCLAGLWLTRRT